jgi:hypothetical protein
MGEQGRHFEGDLRRSPPGIVTLVRQVVQGCLPGELTIALPGLGELVIRPAVLDGDAAWLWNSRRSCAEVPIACAGVHARLLVENGFALHTANALLGRGPSIAAGTLSRIERGLLHGVLAALSARLGLLVMVGACAEDLPAPNSESMVIETSVRLRGGLGRAWLCASAEFLAKILATRMPTWKESSAMVCLELGRTRVPASQLAAANPGDVVVFDEVVALPAADPWPVGIRIGSAVFPGSLRPDGVLASQDGHDLGSVTRAERRPAPAPGYSATPSPVATENCEQIVAEIGRFHGDSLASLLGGNPIEGGRGDSTVLRREGEFAVRITRKLAG